MARRVVRLAFVPTVIHGEATLSPPISAMQMPVEPEMRMHGQRRFWDPIEGRYFRYRRPELMRAVCKRCKAAIAFFAKEVPSHEFDETSGGWLVLRGAICGAIVGRGGCGQCGQIVNELQWPHDAYFKVAVPEGLVWAWNETYLPVLQARVAGNKVAVRQFTMKDRWLDYFVARIPKFALLTKNRERILVGLSRLRSTIQLP